MWLITSTFPVKTRRIQTVMPVTTGRQKKTTLLKIPPEKAAAVLVARTRLTLRPNGSTMCLLTMVGIGTRCGRCGLSCTRDEMCWAGRSGRSKLSTGRECPRGDHNYSILSPYSAYISEGINFRGKTVRKVFSDLISSLLQHACNIKFVGVRDTCLISKSREHLYLRNIPAAIR